ncbi:MULTISPECIES: DUF4292 domain-containing protein [Petrimonas]|jgi:hypothetical protein|uniref:DUF4292 domain-containing protein n=1 Tax=Petrimonas mucosa TaxID=1642646 RepID=A0A1G4G4S4_9BACT|nr:MULTISPECIES: DUF4292 domain-containing protein [Petrimonas]MDD3561467.1 DUF4292 domain-containing protein [Petrimonas mucosa]SCM55886.1 putative protein {ECO:0000313/EMBL:CEA16653,1} [Petrimonas mucosa]SFU45032.1 protein of unknown function [Porphyromonadaceae bacterium KHP3R9]HHT30538.1 DUF4292 domain-containing protein [Petrimonas mucosa]
MNYRKAIIFLLGLLVVVVGLHSCRAKKRIVAAAPVEEKVDVDLFADILENQFIFSTFSSKLNLVLSSGTRSLSSKANLKIVKDKAIQLSIQPLFGVEMIRLYADRDTIVLLDRMNKRYVKEAIGDVRRIYPVGFDFHTLQSLLTNRVFISGKMDLVDSDYEYFSTGQLSDMHYLLKSADDGSGIEYGFTIDGNDRVALAYLMEPEKNYSMSWKYDEFVKAPDRPFPHKMDIVLVSANRKMNVGLEFSGITLDEDFTLQISVPGSYTRATLADVIKMLTANR